MSNDYVKKDTLEEFSSEGHNSEDSEQNLFHDKIYKLQGSGNQSHLQSSTNPTSAMINLSQVLPINVYNPKSNTRNIKLIKSLKLNDSPIKKINKKQENENSVLAKYRKDLEKNKLKIDKEIERSLAVKYKHSELYKKLKREEELEKKRIEEEKQQKLEMQANVTTVNTNAGNTNTEGGFSPTKEKMDKTGSVLRSTKGNMFSTEINVIDKRKSTQNSFSSYPSPIKNTRSEADKILLKKLEDTINKAAPNKETRPTVSRFDKNFNKDKIDKNINDIVATVTTITEEKPPEKPAYQRKRTYSVKLIPGWFEKNGLPTIAINSGMISSVDDQSSIIVDQLKVLLDNFQLLKSRYLSNRELVKIFRSMELQASVKFNKLLEELIGLLLEIPKMILLDFSEYMDKFVAFKAPSNNRIKDRVINDEEDNFLVNIRLLSDCNSYLKSCFDVYNILIKQVDDMLVPLKSFQMLMQYLARSRYSISSMIMSFKNQMRNMQDDQKTLKKVQIKKKAALDDDISRDEVKRKPPIPKLTGRPKKNKIDISENIKKQFLFKSNEDNQRISRLNGVLSTKNPYLSAKDEGKQNSDEMTKLLKYCTKSVKEVIMSERIIERYREMNDGGEVVVDSD